MFDPVRMAAAAYLARYRGWSRVHNDTDLRCWLAWCTGRNLPPLTGQRVHIELFIRWLQEVRHLTLRLTRVVDLLPEEILWRRNRPWQSAW